MPSTAEKAPTVGLVNVSDSSGQAGRGSKYTTIDKVLEAAQALLETIGRALEDDMAAAERELKRKKFWNCSQKRRIRQRMESVPRKVNEAHNEFSRVLEKNYAPMAESMPRLLEEQVPAWQEFGQGIEKVQSTIEAQLRLEKWDSKGADQYKQVIPVQQKALTELKQMALNGARSADYVAMINGFINEVALQSIEIVRVQVSALEPPPEGPTYVTEELGSVDMAANVLKRSEKSAAMLRGLTKWLTQIARPESAWGSTAARLTSSISTMRASGKNLKPGGGWPESVAAETPEPFVLDLGDLQAKVRAFTDEADDIARTGNDVDNAEERKSRAVSGAQKVVDKVEQAVQGVAKKADGIVTSIFGKNDGGGA